jgi:hypothetical protein
MGERIGKRYVDNLQTTGKEYFAWDGDLPGFGVRVRASGAKAYVFQYRAGAGRSAPSRRVTIGSVGSLTPEQARKIANLLSGEVGSRCVPPAGASPSKPASSRGASSGTAARRRSSIPTMWLGRRISQGCRCSNPSIR